MPTSTAPTDKHVPSHRPSGLCYLIGRLDHALTRRMLEALTPIGLTVSQYTALSFLDSETSISNAQLAVRTFISPQSANEMVKQMSEKGWVEREPDPCNKRVVRLSITPTGKNLLLQAHAAVARIEACMLAEFTQAQRKAMHDKLRQVLQVLSDAKPTHGDAK